LNVERVCGIGHLEGTAALDALDDDVVHLVVLHTPHKLLEKLGALLITFGIG
jgi:hypothetical protein